ncbi:MAG: hypothetical protein KAS86_04880, partial [Candidatus Omnitrophica bacterium]|nr:hypothetical protein [Candidatus Omnitrophota bacterium]
RALEKMLSSGTLSPEHYELTLKELRKKCSIFAEGSKKRNKIEESDYYRNLSEKYPPAPYTLHTRPSTLIP